jgi:hypothetical protein
VSEIEEKSASRITLLFRNLISTPEKKFLSVFLSLSIFAWGTGIVTFQIHEAQVKREAAAIKLANKLAEENAKKERFAKLSSLWEKSKYSNWDSFDSGIKFKSDTSKQCKGSKECAYIIFVSKFNCDVFSASIDFISTTGAKISTDFQSAQFVSSLEPIPLYFESTKNGPVKSLEWNSVNCEGLNY